VTKGFGVAEIPLTKEFMNYRNILITGGTGFIGQHLARSLVLNAKAKLWIFDNLHEQVHGANSIPPVSPHDAVFIRGDITNPSDLREVLTDSNPDAIVHLAAATGTGQSMDEISRYCDVNVTGTARLLELAKEYAPKLKRLILASSRAVYGEGLYRTLDNQLIVPAPRSFKTLADGQFEVFAETGERLQPLPTMESTPPSPCSIYGSTKLMQEYLVTQAKKDSDWNATILRLQNVYGPGQSMINPYTGVLSIFLRQLMNNQPLEIYEDGEITRDFVFIDDVINAFELTLKADLSHGTVINIGSAMPTVLVEIAKELLRLFEKPTDMLKVTGAFRIGDVRHAVANIDRAQRLLDWKPRFGITEGLQLWVRWCQDKPTESLTRSVDVVAPQSRTN
jgi:dTDP-L-rhamnose 4-epimerase